MLRCFHGGTVVQSLASRDRFEAIRELILKAPIFDGIEMRKKVVDAVIQREKVLSTGLGKGVAVAHGTTNAVDQIIIALGISNAGIDFEAIDNVPVHLLFVITNPPDKQVEYLMALAAVTRLVRDDTFRGSLQDEASSNEIEHRICDAFTESLKKYSRIAV